MQLKKVFKTEYDCIVIQFYKINYIRENLPATRINN